MYNYHFIIEYDGTGYSGWQKQKKVKTIQDSIEKVLKRILREKINVIGSGRTDRGVHASAQSAHFITKKKIKSLHKFLSSINFFLRDKQISVLEIKKKKISFHSRFDAKMRTYTYLIVNRKSRPILHKDRAWHISKKLNFQSLKKACRLLKGKKDFTTFRSSSCNAKSPIRTINKAKVIKKDDMIKFIFESKSFLQHQVRSMVGCIKYVGEGKWSNKKFKSIIDSKKRSFCAPPAPPEGLYLTRVDY